MMDRLCSIPMFENAWKIYAGERNTGHVSGMHAMEVMSKPEYGRTYCLREFAGKNFGVWTSKERKEHLWQHMNDVLSKQALFFYDNFVVYNPDDKPEKFYRTELVKMFGAQLRQLVPDGRGGFTATRDVEGKKTGGHQDMAMSALIALYFYIQFKSRNLPYVDYGHFYGTSVGK